MRIDLSQDPEFGAGSWAKWREILDRVDEDKRELWVTAGRGSGKTRIASRIVVEAAMQSWPHAPGERIFCALVAPSRDQALIAMSYARAAIPPEMVIRETRDTLELVNDNIVQVVTASTAAPRGRSYAVAVLDELAFFAVEDAADPDEAILQGIRPGLARVRGSLLVCISSPWAKRGALWKAAQKWGETGGDQHHVYAQFSTTELNPLFAQSEIDRAMADDPSAANTEYGGLFRSDAEVFLSRDLIDAAVEHRGDLPYCEGFNYVAFCDPSGGSGDGYTLCVAHAEGVNVVVDALHEVRPPFDPDEATERLAQVVQRYGLARVTGDKYGGEWPRSRWRAHNVQYVPAEKSATALYQAMLPLFASGRIRVPNNQRLVTQLVNLERTVSRSGRETIGHPPSAHDDLANAVAGAAHLASAAIGAAPLVAHAVWGGGERRQPDGIDPRGRAWKDNRPWTGTFPELTHFSPKGIPTEWPPKFEEGRRVELTEAEQEYYRAHPPRPPKRQRVIW